MFVAACVNEFILLICCAWLHQRNIIVVSHSNSIGFAVKMYMYGDQSSDNASEYEMDGFIFAPPHVKVKSFRVFCKQEWYI